MRKPESIILIAADTMKQLRCVDVFRVLDDCSDDERKPLARAIIQAHPDYAGEIKAYWNEVLPLEEHVSIPGREA